MATFVVQMISRRLISFAIAKFKMTGTNFIPEKIPAWANICNKIVRTAIAANLERIHQLVGLLASDDETYSTRDFLGDCGCDNATIEGLLG